MASSPAARRRQRSTRLTVAVVLLLLAAAFVATATVLASTPLITAAAVAGVVLGTIATRITHTELMQSRREADRGHAEQAQAYAALTGERVAENLAFADGMSSRLRSREQALGQIEEALCAAQRRAADATRQARSEAERAHLAETEVAAYAGRLDEAEERAAEAIVRVAELEQERDLLSSELEAWQAVGVEGLRKHA